MSADSSAVRSAVIALEIFPWYSIQRLSSDLSIRTTKQAVVAAAVDLDAVPVGGLGVERRAHDARDLVLAAHDPDVADRRARQADDRREVVEHRGQERRAGVGDAGDDPVRRRVHELQDVVGILEPSPFALDGRGLEHLRPAADDLVSHASGAFHTRTAAARSSLHDGGEPARGATTRTARTDSARARIARGSRMRKGVRVVRATQSRGAAGVHRLAGSARRRVEDGEHDWFTSPRIDSYHTVWMELHEELLVALGRERGR